MTSLKHRGPLQANRGCQEQRKRASVRSESHAVTNENDLSVFQGTIAATYPRAKELVAHFYGRLFGRCPEIESLFAGTAVQQQHAKL